MAAPIRWVAALHKNDSYSTTTNSNYTFEFPKIGQYSLTATLAGVQTLTKGGITVDDSQTVRVDSSLQIGQVTE